MPILSKQIVKLIIKNFLFNNPLSKKRLKTLEQRAAWNLDDLEKFQEQKIFDTLLSAKKKIPAYANIKIPSSYRGVKEFLRNEIPVISKSDLLENKKLYYPAKYPWVTVGRTSGTSGTPLEIFRSYNSVIWEKAFIKRHWSVAGIEFKRATLRGDEVVSASTKNPPFWHYTNNDQLVISSAHLKPNTIKNIINEIQSFNPSVLQAYPSTAFILAEYLDKTDTVLSVKYVFTGSEMLYPYQREVIEKTIGRVVDFYGMAERVAMATECIFGNLHVNMDYSYVEILDDNNLPTEGLGYVVGTTFHNSAMPLIRYKLSDMTKWKKGSCECGSHQKMIEPISGKYEDRIYNGDNVAISPSLITFAFKGVSNIKMAQVAQINNNTWEVRVVPDDFFSGNDSSMILSNLKELVGNSTDIKLKLVDDIPRTKAGKFRWVKNEFHTA